MNDVGYEVGFRSVGSFGVDQPSSLSRSVQTVVWLRRWMAAAAFFGAEEGGAQAGKRYVMIE